MAPKKTTTKPRKRSIKAPARKMPTREMEEVWQGTQKLVKALLETLAKGIDSPAHMPEHWERLFGTKDSAVANLQKLVALLIELRTHFNEVPDAAEMEQPPIEVHELEMLEAWLKKQKPIADV